MRTFALGLALLVVVAMPALASDDDDWDDDGLRGGQILFHIGVFEPHGESDLWDFNEEFLTQDLSDFDDVIGGVAFSSPLNAYLDIMFGAQYYDAETRVRYRDIFTIGGDPIRQNHRLRELPLDVSLKFFPIPRETRGRRGRRILRPIVPYLGGGGGAFLWSYEERGNFVDDPEAPTFTFRDKRRGRGVAGSLHALAGVEVQFTPQFAIWMEGRYRWVKDDLGSDFEEGLDRFDLGGGNLAVGASVRF